MKLKKNARHYVKSIARVLIATTVALATLLGAMQLTGEVSWGAGDFIMIGSILVGAGFIFEFLVIGIKNTKHRVAAAILLLVAVLLVWAEIAVGVLGTPFAGS